MKNLKIFTKLFLSHTTIGLLSLIALSSIVYFVISGILIQRTLDQLSSINILKEDLIENYFSNSYQNLQELQLENKFLNLYKRIHTDRDTTSKQSIHDLLEINSIRKLYDFRSLYLFTNDGKLLFQTDKSKFPAGIKSKIDSIVFTKRKEIHAVDVTEFSKDKETLLYYYIPVIEGKKIVGVVYVLENMRKIQKILLENTGLGNTGESYLIGRDFTMRSSSRFFPGKMPASIVVRTEASAKSFQGISGQGIFPDYRHVQVLSVYRPVALADLNWSIVSEIDWEEAVEPIINLRNYLIIVTLIIIVSTLIITFFISNAIARPILQLKEIIIALSKGINPLRKPTITTKDEIGLMAHAVEELIEGMERTTAFANEIGSGNFNTEFTKLSDEDRLGHALLRMRDELRNFHEREIRLAREHASAVIEGQEIERRRIVSDLHDGVGQLLTAIRMRVEMLGTEDRSIQDIKTQINETIAEVKRISYNVMPQALVDFGLEAALKGLCDNIKKYATVTIDFRYVKECDHVLNFEMTIAIFRIVQEGLNNILKHAEAKHVNLHVLDKEDELYLVLEDNGKGFDEHKISKAGLGLRNIRERAKLLNGDAEISSTEGYGTVIEVHIPIADTRIKKPS